METNLNRIIKEIEEFSNFNTTPGKGITRFSYSDADKAARNYLIQQFESLDLEVSIDAVGNMRAKRNGIDRNAPTVMTGSHIDTVPYGGKFDGVVGIVGALEVIHVLNENNIQTKHPIEVVIFEEEEGSNFMSTMAGSKTMTGKYGPGELKKIVNNEGISMYEVTKSFGLSPEKARDFVIKPGEIKAMIELHIEQGAVLDAENIPIGIVVAIAGIKTYIIEIKGISNHAGATPMHLRNNPMSAAAEVISQIDTIVTQKANAATVATVGKIICEPNIPNIIPGKVIFTLDVRDVHLQGINRAVTEVEKLLDITSKKHRVKKQMKVVGESDPIKLAHDVIEIIKQEANNRGLKYKLMNSGAVHDSSLLAGITNVGMIFVPSVKGRSHVPNENTEFGDIKQGCDLLLGSIYKLSS
jgi:hydantoinase/carbamoylase family amidase